MPSQTTTTTKSLSPPPATGTSVPTAKQRGKIQTKFIDILKTDHGFDIIKSIISEMRSIKTAKKMSPIDKRRLLKDYNLALLAYCMPKIKVIEDNTNQNAKPMNFQINIGLPDQQSKAQKNSGRNKKKSPVAGKMSSGISVTIPTKKNPDGTYTV